MATNLAIDPDLLDRALEVSGERTKKAALIAQLCIRHDVVLLSTDQDFVHVAKHCSLKVWSSKGLKSRR